VRSVAGERVVREAVVPPSEAVVQAPEPAAAVPAAPASGEPALALVGRGGGRGSGRRGDVYLAA
jgi:hypothetical protein